MSDIHRRSPQAPACQTTMPRYAFIVKALSPRDMGWVRLGCYFRSEEDAWQFFCCFFSMLVRSGDYITVTVERTIVF
jgi:hypothetical protein